MAKKYYCPVCGYESDEPIDVCPVCGAKMAVREEGETSWADFASEIKYSSAASAFKMRMKIRIGIISDFFTLNNNRNNQPAVGKRLQAIINSSF